MHLVLSDTAEGAAAQRQRGSYLGGLQRAYFHVRHIPASGPSEIFRVALGQPHTA